MGQRNENNQKSNGMKKHFTTIRGELPRNFPLTYPHIGYKVIANFFILSYTGDRAVLNACVESVLGNDFQLEVVGSKSVDYEQ